MHAVLQLGDGGSKAEGFADKRDETRDLGARQTQIGEPGDDGGKGSVHDDT